jgi:hypothetical protein
MPHLFDRVRRRPKRRPDRPEDPHIAQARSVVLVGGLPESVARAAERHGEVDWRPLAAALDSLFVARGGGLGVRRFLLSPHASLSGRAPVEVIERGGVESVALAAYRESTRVELEKMR